MSTEREAGEQGTSNAQRSLAGRPYRRLRRWARHTPNGTMALNMACAGVALIVIALVIAIAT